MTDTQTKTILLVEDELEIAQLLIDYLQANGYHTQHFSSGEGVIEFVKTQTVDCAILDIMLPNAAQFGDGLELCRDIRTLSTLPIMMLTARIEEIDRILGLELGADDYLCKPFSPREVVARVKALLRRAQIPHTATPTSNSWQLDRNTYHLEYQHKSVALSAVEFEILSALAEHPGRIYSRNQLINSIYPDNRVVSDRTIDSHIKKLRQKLNQSFGDNEWIQSVYGVGYKLVPPTPKTP